MITSMTYYDFMICSKQEQEAALAELAPTDRSLLTAMVLYYLRRDVEWLGTATIGDLIEEGRLRRKAAVSANGSAHSGVSMNRFTIARDRMRPGETDNEH